MSRVVFAEQSAAPGQQAATKVALYVDNTATPQLKMEDDAATVTTMLDGANTVAQITNKDFADASTTISNVSATSKAVKFSSSGATAATILTVANQQSTSQTLSVPNITGADTIVTTTLNQTVTGVKTLTNPTTAAGTNAIPSMTITHGANLTNAIADGIENDAIGMYLTTNTSDGRGHIPARQHFRLTSNGSNITTTIANFFGASSNISLVASAYYEIEIVCWFTKTTSEALTWTFTNSAAPTSMNIHVEQSPVTGVVTTAAGYLGADIVASSTAAQTYVTGALTTAVNHFAKFRITLKNGTGTSLKIQATNPAGSITPLLGSYWTAVRIPTGNTGTFAA